MKLSLTLADERTVVSAYSHYNTSDKREEYERAAVESLSGSPETIAAYLRGLADEINPPRSVSLAADRQFAKGGFIQ